MPKLYIENGADRGKTYVITAEGPFFLGRDDAAQVQIRDEMASRRHIQIEFRDGGHHLRDLDSSNGTLLNGRQVRGVQPLTSNDRIQIGDTIITYIDENKPSVIGQTISGYRILDRIGRGGMGTVYRALQTSLDRVVALKILAPHLTANTNFVNLFIREARAAGALSHPNIVQVYDVGVEGETYFYSMEYMPNGSVEDMLVDSEGALPVERCLQIVRDSALGLEYAEEKGIVHRDIKPGNLMVGANGVIKIGDLGIARSTEEDGTLSQKDGVSGSPHYIAPEQARGQDIDHRADIYALGVSFYQILSGKTPFTGTTPREVILKHIREEAPALTEIAPDVPEGVAQVVRIMMEKDRDKRPLSATALLEELRPLLSEHAADSGPVEPPPQKSQLKTFLFMLVGVAVIAAVAIGSIIFFANKRARDNALLEQRTRIESVLEDAEAKIVRGEFEAAEGDLDTVDAEPDLPEDLDQREDRLREKLAAAVETARLAALEREAEIRHQEIMAGQPKDPDSTQFLAQLDIVITQLRQFVNDDRYLDLETEVEQWGTQLKALEKQRRERHNLERDAARQLRDDDKIIGPQLENKAFGLAWNIHDEYPEKFRFGATRVEWEARGAELVAAAGDHWRLEQVRIEQLCGSDVSRARSEVGTVKRQLGEHFQELQAEIDQWIDNYGKSE